MRQVFQNVDNRFGETESHRAGPIVNRELDLNCIALEDADVYRKAARLSERFIVLEPERVARRRANPCVVMLFKCMDEKEADGEASFGLLPGEAIVYQTAGNQIGDANLVLCKEMQAAIDRAAADGKILLVLFVTHESKSYPHTDGCAAFGHDGPAADANAIREVSRFNIDYVDRGAQDQVMRRHVIAVRLTSYTDLETHVWHGDHGSIDPLEFMQQNGAQIDRNDLLTKVMSRFSETFPYHDERFSGLSRGRWVEVMRQMANMFIANMGYAKDVVSGKTPPSKCGHRGTRILVGRGWNMFDEVGKYFKVTDLTPDFRRECYIAGKYVTRNAILRLMQRGETSLSVPFHVNVPYDMERPADRSGSIRHAMALALAIKQDWEERLTNRDPRLKFLADLLDALHHEGVNALECPSLDIVTPDILRFYISVSPRETRRPELVATGADL